MPPANRTRRTQAERVAQAERALLDAAVQLIGEQGYTRTTAAEIGERAGYSRSIVRLRYGSKEALLTSLLREVYERRLLPTRDERWPGLEQALAQVEWFQLELGERREQLRAFCVLSFESAGDPELSSWMHGWLGRYHRQVTDALVTGQADGSVRPDIDPTAEIDHFMTFGLGINYHWAMTQDDQVFLADLREWDAVYRARWSAQH